MELVSQLQVRNFEVKFIKLGRKVGKAVWYLVILHLWWSQLKPLNFAGSYRIFSNKRQSLFLLAELFSITD
jgi:hypothetical protein